MTPVAGWPAASGECRWATQKTASATMEAGRAAGRLGECWPQSGRAESQTTVPRTGMMPPTGKETWQMGRMCIGVCRACVCVCVCVLALIDHPSLN